MATQTKKMILTLTVAITVLFAACQANTATFNGETTVEIRGNAKKEEE